jgi:hypothetical protein
MVLKISRLPSLGEVALAGCMFRDFKLRYKGMN